MAGRKKPIAEENPLFGWILIIDVVVLLIYLGIMSFTVQMEGERANAMFEVGRNGFTLLAGTFAGLVGAKAGRPGYLADVAPPVPSATRAKKGVE